MIYFVIAVVIILCNIVGFCHAANKSVYNSFISKIYDSMLLWILGTTIGIVGTLIGWIYSKISWVNFKKRHQDKKDTFYVTEYGAKVDELGEKIRQSPNVQKIADTLLNKVDKKYLPVEIFIKHDNIHWFVENGNSRVTHKIQFQDLSIAPIPTEHERTLAKALADIPSIKIYWEYNNEIDYCERLCLKREYRLSGLSKW